jgi:hypothetical protein
MSRWQSGTIEHAAGTIRYHRNFKPNWISPGSPGPPEAKPASGWTVLKIWPKLGEARSFSGKSKLGPLVRLNACAQEFVAMRNLRHLPDSEEFGLCHGHPLGLEEEVTEVLVATPPTEQSFDVAVDGFHHSEANFGPDRSSRSLRGG